MTSHAFKSAPVLDVWFKLSTLAASISFSGYDPILEFQCEVP